MAREEHPREDLLAEATALVERIELSCGDPPQTVVVGFRQDGAPSFYFGEELVFQFNAEGELRRAFRDGLMLKAVQGRLTALERRRTKPEVQLLSRELHADDTAAVLDDFLCRASELAEMLETNRYECRGQVPAEVNVIARVQHLLRMLTAGPIEIARTPHAR